MEKYPFEHPPPTRKYDLRIRHNAKIVSTESLKQYHSEANVVMLRDLDINKASLTMFDDIATNSLGYQNAKFVFLSPETFAFSEITTDEDLTDKFSELSRSRELDIYIVGGVKKDIKLITHPTILSWNCHSLNDPSLTYLTALVKIYDPDILFLMETRMSSEYIGSIASELGFKNARASHTNKHMKSASLQNCVGLAMFWKNMELEFYDKSENYLDFVVKGSNNICWRLIGFYGHPTDKALSWVWLKKLCKESPPKDVVASVVIGDFNEILEQHEKEGRNQKNADEMKNFKTALNECDLHDNIPLRCENMFTWMGNGAKERLDRAVCTPSWKNEFCYSRVLHLGGAKFSDHIPILLETNWKQQRLESILIISERMTSFVSFLKYVECACAEPEIPTVYRFHQKYATMPEHFYDIAHSIASRLIQLEYIAVQEEDVVTCERLITLMTRRHLSILMLNNVVFPKPNYYDFPELLEFPSARAETKKVPKRSRETKEAIQINLSKCFADTWVLINLIPEGAQIYQQQIVDKIILGQVENLIKCFLELTSPQLQSQECSEIVGKLCEASVVAPAVILYNTIHSLLEEDKIEFKGDISDLKRKVAVYFKSHVLLDILIGEPLQFLVDTFGWRLNDSQYRIADTNEEEKEKQLAKLEQILFEAERGAVIAKNMEPWLKLIRDNGLNKDGRLNKEELIKLVDKSTIEEQLKALITIGCISRVNNDKIRLSQNQGNPKAIIERLQNAEREAFKSIKSTVKTMSN